MNWSFWEIDTWLKDIDLVVIGSGIVGLSTAIHYKEKHPSKKVVVLDKGSLPQGASTKNAGFACFGSLSEILSDLKTHSEQEVVDLVAQRWNGLKKLRSIVSDDQLDFLQLGGYEVFQKDQAQVLKECLSRLAYINRLLWPVFKENVFDIHRNKFGFEGVETTLILNKFEGQIHTGMMMKSLLKKAEDNGVEVFFGAEVATFSKGEVKLANGSILHTENIAVCTNGFGGKFGFQEVQPARAQVLITEEIPDLKVKGTFHLDEGYYYFRNIGNRILLGGGRNLDFSTEETSEFGLTDLIQNRLDQLLKEVIHPQFELQVEQRWSGVMGVGAQKKPIIKKVSPGIYCGLRLGGMGVALGSQVGSDLADLI